MSVHAVSATASCPLQWRLFVPEERAADSVRRHKTGIPDETEHREKWRLAMDSIDESAEWGLIPPVLVADASYRQNADFRDGLERRGIGYLVAVRSDARGRPRSAGSTEVTWQEGSREPMRSHFALRRRHRYATVIIDAETHERIDVLPGRTADTLEAWLREQPGIEIMCRDGSATYAEGEVKAHSACWATVLDRPSTTGPAPRPPWNAGTRSTGCSTRASACSSTPAVRSQPEHGQTLRASRSA